MLDDDYGSTQLKSVWTVVLPNFFFVSNTYFASASMCYYTKIPLLPAGYPLGCAN